MQSAESTDGEIIALEQSFIRHFDFRLFDL